MQYLERYQLQMAGDGDISEELEKLVAELGLRDRVEFLGRLPFQELREQTRQASLGISLEEDLGLNYRYALPNKLFDYIQAGIPVLVSDLPEMRNIIETYAIGEILQERNPQIIARQVSRMMESDALRMNWKKNLRVAADELSWEKEEPKLLNLYRRALQD
jgi:glycosyltransferase involved in cell wall biosynthesis